MGLANVVRGAVTIARGVTADLQVTVLHQAWGSHDGDGAPVYGPMVPRQALVTLETKPVRAYDGTERLSSAQVVFLGNVTVDVRDRLTLPGGRTAPIVRVSGFSDPAVSGGVYLQEVALA